MSEVAFLTYAGETYIPRFSDGIYGVVRDDYEMVGKSRPSINNAPRRTKSLPMVHPYHFVEFSWLDPEMQEWICELSTEACGADLTFAQQKHYMDNLFQYDTAFTNFEPNLDYGTDMTIKLMPVLCGRRAILKLRSEKPNSKGLYAFDLIDTSKPYKHYHPTTHPHLFFNPVSSHRVEQLRPNGQWTGEYYGDGVNPFWEFMEKTVLPIHGRPMAGKEGGVGFIEAEKIRILRHGESIPELHTTATKLEVR